MTVLGSRGSAPISNRSMTEFGGATSCYMLETESEIIFLDAGSGIINAPAAFPADKRITILLSHAHSDHIIGLPYFGQLFREERSIDIYGCPREGMTTEEQVGRLLSPPLWPVSLDSYPARTVCRDIVWPLRLGDVLVEGMESNHPGGSVIFRIRHGGTSIVCATDYEHSAESMKELEAFAEGADLLMYDGQYTEAEYETKKGFGHSIPEIGLGIFRRCGAKRLLIVHHDPGHTDDMLREMEEAIRADGVSFAREGEVIFI